MRDENLKKISGLADRTVADTTTANILLCYTLEQIGEPIDSELLYDIAVSSGIINYFTFQEALQIMEETEVVNVVLQKNGEKCYSITEKGLESAQRLQHLAGKSYRERIIRTASVALKRHKNEEQVKVSYEPISQGCHLHVKMLDHQLTLLELTLFTPDEYQAKLLGEKILTNPSALYHDVMQAVMPKEEN
ncbi:MAG: DUF4364 family protein [Oscillospiraceae bacterium]|nr:DUF4364 family protein [Oscillospiraceae bacterium]MDE5885175.1 DUF4364 family protein [Oscillospiraceae bacterium]